MERWKREHFFFVLQEHCIVNTNFLDPCRVLQILQIPRCRITVHPEVCTLQYTPLYQHQADASLVGMCVSPWSLYVHGVPHMCFSFKFLLNDRLSENAYNHASVMFPNSVVALSVFFMRSSYRITVAENVNVIWPVYLSTQKSYEY